VQKSPSKDAEGDEGGKYQINSILFREQIHNNDLKAKMFKKIQIPNQRDMH
jgi:hypothetical protein